MPLHLYRSRHPSRAKLEGFRPRGLLRTVRSPADTRYKQHPNLRARGQNLGVMSGATDQLRRLNAALLGCPHEERTNIRVHRHGRALQESPNVESERALRRDRAAQRANPLLERAPRTEIGVAQVNRK